MIRTFFLLLVSTAHVLAQLSLSPAKILIRSTQDAPPDPTLFDIDVGSNVSFAFDHIEATSNNAPNFLLLFPKVATGASLGFVGLNRQVIRRMKPGTYSLVAVYKTTDPLNPQSAFLSVALVLSPSKNAPDLQSVVSSTSRLGNLSPGVLISILGKNFGSAGPQQFDGFGFYPTIAEGTTVTFNGIAAPILNVSPWRIDAMVPYELAGQSSADVVVSTFTTDEGSSRSSASLTVPLTDTAPALFTADGSGTGRALVYNDPNQNSPDSPLAADTQITFQVTGVGQYISQVKGFGPFNPAGFQLTGQIVPYNGFQLYSRPQPLEPVRLSIPLTVTIGGLDTYVSSLQPLIYQPWDVLQVVATIPKGVPSGQQPIVVKIGNNDNSAQNVTIVIQ